MKEANIIGLDLAKRSFQAHGALERAAANLNRLRMPNRGCSNSTCWLGGGQQGWLQHIRRICAIG